MPRSADGGYSLPPGTLVASGDTLLPSQHNPAMQDIAAALGNSLDRNGAGGMRAPLEMGSNRVRNMGDGVADADAATMAQLNALQVQIAANANAMPVGSVLDFAGSVAPTNFALCFGQAISRTDFSALFALVGVTYGPGDGSTTFNLPDARGRVVAGKDDMGGTASGRLTSISNALGAAGGEQSHTLTIGEMPAHTHNMNGYSGAKNNGAGPAGTSDIGTAQEQVTQSTGSGEAHNNVQPTLILNKIIKVKAA